MSIFQPLSLFKKAGLVFQAGAWNDRLYLLCITALIVFVLIWIACKIISFFNDLFGNTLMPENEVRDEDDKLAAELDGLGPRVQTVINAFLNEQKVWLTETIDQSVSDLLSRSEVSEKNISELLNHESNLQKIDLALSEIQKTHSQKIAEFNHKLMIKIRGLNLENNCRSFISESLDKLVAAVQPSYIIFKKEEDLRWEPGDTLTVKGAKTVRRGFRWAERKTRIFTKKINLLRSKQPPMVFVRQISYQKILQKRLIVGLAEDFQPLFKKLGQVPTQIQSAFLDVGRVFRFNLECAAAEIADPKDNVDESDILKSVQQTVFGAYDRVQGKLEAIRKSKQETLDSFEGEFRRLVDLAVRRAKRDCEFADTIGEIVTRFSGQVTEVLKSKWTLYRRDGHRFLSKGKGWWSTVQEKFSNFQIGLGIKSKSVTAIVGALDNATVEYSQKKIPAIYKRVFQYEPLTDDEFFIGRQKELSLLEEARNRWINGQPSSVAIYGPIGSGKTSLIQCAIPRLFADMPVFTKTLDRQIHRRSELVQFLNDLFRIDLGTADMSLEDLALAVKSKAGRAVVVVEGAQHLFVRKIGGFSTLHDFLGLMMKTRSDLLWVVGFNEIGWAYLNYTKLISQHFHYQISSKNLSKDNLQKAILTRHNLTGYQMEFLEEGLPLDIKWRLDRIKDPKMAQAFLMDQFFVSLHAITGGNIYAAIYYWLCAVEFLGQEKIRVHSPKPIPMDPLRKLNWSQLSTILALLQHGTLDPALHAEVFRAPNFRSDGLLAELEGQKILLKRGPHHYGPNPIVVPALLSVLKERNLVYHE